MGSLWDSDIPASLRGQYQSLYAAAVQGGRSAANMWDAFRSAAYDSASSTLALTSPTPPTQLEIDAAAKSLMGGVTIQDMNRVSKVIGEQLRATENLKSLGLDQQITGDAIFTPPWARTTGNPAVPTRYRIRVQRQVTYRGIGVTTNKWATYEITAPLTSVNDALAQANTLFARNRYNLSANIDAVLDYSIEAV